MSPDELAGGAGGGGGGGGVDSVGDGSAGAERTPLPAACRAVDADLPELALGTLNGRPRAAALTHVESCPRCSAELEQLSMAADGLLHLAAEAEPPVGFEVRLFDRLGIKERVPAPRRLARARWLAIAAVVVAIAVGFTVGWLAGPSRSGTATSLHGPTAAGRYASADLVSSGHDLGQVSTYAGHPGWIVMTIEHARVTGPVSCQVTTVNGVVYQVGRFKLSGGYGAWDARLPVPPGRVTVARVIGRGGVTLAVARLPA